MNVVTLWLSKQYIRSIRGGLVRVETIRLPNEEDQEVIVISSGKWPLLGQRTFFGTIIIHELAFRTERLLNYVVIHEIGHKKQWYGYFIYPLVIVCVLVSLFFLLGALWSLFASIMYLNASYLLSMLVGLVIAVFSLVILGLYSWALELNAEFYAIRKLGLQGVLDARADMPKSPKFAWYLRALSLLTHPPTSLTIRIYHWTHKRQ